MKSTTLFIILFVAGLSAAVAQSNSFQTLKDKFSEREDVHSFRTSGFFARSVLWLAGEYAFTRAIKEVRNIRLITIPKSAFADKALSVRGFKKVVRKDSYDELARIRDHDEEVSIYLQTIKKATLNRYLILIDNPDEVVAVEIMGYIDPDILQRIDNNLSYSN